MGFHYDRQLSQKHMVYFHGKKVARIQEQIHSWRTIVVPIKVNNATPYCYNVFLKMYLIHVCYYLYVLINQLKHVRLKFFIAVQEIVI